MHIQCRIEDSAVFFRVDSSTEQGSGHLMRCLTLATELSKYQIAVVFISREFINNSIELIKEYGFDVVTFGVENDEMSVLSVDGAFELEDARRVYHVVDASAASNKLVVLDSYYLGFEWEQFVRSPEIKVLVIDDLKSRSHSCDLFLDFNFQDKSAQLRGSRLSDGCVKMLGPKYSLVRKEFADMRGIALKKRKFPKKKNILVCMGGSDPDNDTGKVLIGFLRSKFIESIKINVVIGFGNPNKKELEVLCGGHKNIVLHIQTAHMAKLMAEADFAITAGGTTTWERCVLGLPSLVVVQSDDQLPGTIALDRMGAHKCLGYASDISSDAYLESFSKVTHSELLAMSEMSKDICDGNGAARVSEQIFNILKK